MLQHKLGMFEGFTKRYRVDRLMYLETYSDSRAAEMRELQIKKFRREKKVALFRSSNPEWRDLTPEIFQSVGIPDYATFQISERARNFRRSSEFQM